MLSSFTLVVLKSSSPNTKTSLRPSSNFQQVKLTNTTHYSLKPTKPYLHRFSRAKTRATLDEKDQTSISTPLLVQEEHPNKEVEESVKVLKNAAKSRKVVAEEVLSALSVIEKANIDPSGFLDTLGGSKSPGRTWMLVFTSKKQLKGGRYFPITAVQRFDAAAKRIENGVYLGPIGSLTFEGRFSWKKRILAFIFECIRIKIGPLNPLEISLGQNEDREPSTKDPFFIWYYVDEEIAVARGKSGGTAFWCRCRRVTI
uniref:Plastid lipid-associated protein/fibrillin conserved domain-containing protein n=1 Tax=Fagus sylvatica TaxID=28930 RepID=A0A2N9GK51_FAGSY